MSAAVLDPELRCMNLRECLFSAGEESIIEEVLVVLKPMMIATVLISGEKQPTASKILPTLAKIRKEMTVNENLDSELVKEIKQNIIDNLNKRYLDQSISSFLLKATFLDPRYKSLNNIAREGAVFATKQAIKEMCIKYRESKPKNETSVAEASNPDVPCFPLYLLQQLLRKNPQQRFLTLYIQVV